MVEQESLPFPFSIMNAAGEMVSRFRTFPSLDADIIEKRARKATDLNDFGDPQYRKGLEAVLTAARQDGLNYWGRLTIDLQATEYAKARLQWVEMQKQQPAAFATELRPPIIVIGFPRSGTTALHRMLAADPDHQAIPLWRLIAPIPPLNGRADKRQQFAARNTKMMNQMRPELASKHEISADVPEECMVVQGLSFNSIVFFASAPIESYLDWHIAQDHTLMNEEYASVLRWYQSQDGRRLVMKSPSHTAMLPDLVKAVPNALIVHIHRDPVKVVNSINSLFNTNHSGLMATYNRKQIAAANLKMLNETQTRMLAARKAHDLNICDVYHDDLVANPVATARTVYDHFDLPWTDAAVQQMSQHVSKNPRHKHGKHSYSAADFGLTDGEIRAQFAPYSERFNLS